jgi:phage terminase small subunit
MWNKKPIPKTVKTKVTPGNKTPVKKKVKTIKSIDDNIGNELNERQKSFCKRYIFDWNGTKSYKDVYKVDSEDVAAVNSSRLLSYAKIQDFIKYLKENLAEVAGISPLMVLQEHQKIAFSSIAHLHLTWMGKKDFELLTEDQKACIEEISTKVSVIFDKVENKPKEVEYVKIKLYNKQKSLDSINTMMGWDAPSKIDISNPDGTLNNIPTITYSIPDHVVENLKKKG